MFFFAVEGYGTHFVHQNRPPGIVWEPKLHIPSPVRSAGSGSSFHLLKW